MNNRVRTILITVIAVVWAVNFTAPVFVHGYVPPPEIHIIFMAIAGGLVAGYKSEGGKNGKKGKRDEDEELKK